MFDFRVVAEAVCTNSATRAALFTDEMWIDP